MKKLLIVLFCVISILSLSSCSRVVSQGDHQRDEKEIVRKDSVNKVKDQLDSNKLLKDMERIEIHHYIQESMFKETIENPVIIKSILSMIKDSSEYTYNEKLEDRPNIKECKIIIYTKDNKEKEIFYKYRKLYSIGYVKIDNIKLEPKYDFFRYIGDLISYDQHDTDIKKDAKELFEIYDWTIDYRIKTIKETLPGDLRHGAGEYPEKIYWAYNNDLSKGIGLDFSDHLGEDVTLDIYRLREVLPEFLHPNKDARGIVLRYKDKIIGAYIDAGRHYGFACSLDRKSIEEITKVKWNEWIKEHVNYDDDLEKRLSKMTPEEIIKTYFEALNNKDEKVIYGCMTRRALTRYLFSNLGDNKVFNRCFGDNNIKAVRLVEMKKIKNFSKEDNCITYMVIVDYDVKKFITHGDGKHPRFVRLEKEVEDLGWRIVGVATGP